MATTERADLEAFWMPFTANRQFKAHPRLLARAEGMHYWTADGRKVLDGVAGLWCVNAGHGRKEIAAAVERQLMNLDFAPSFNMGHPLAFDFAERLAEIAPKGLDRIFFTNSGSESVDTALKMALAYQRAIGQGTRTRLIGRERGYHGVGFGGMSVGGMVANRRAFATHLPGVDHIRHTHDLARNGFAKDQPEHGAELADDLERGVDRLGAGIGEEDAVEPLRRDLGEPFGEIERQWMAHVERGREVEVGQAALDGSGDLAAAMAGIDAPENGRAVDYLAAVDRGVVHALGGSEQPRRFLELPVGCERHPERIGLQGVWLLMKGHGSSSCAGSASHHRATLGKPQQVLFCAPATH